MQPSERRGATHIETISGARSSATALSAAVGSLGVQLPLLLLLVHVISAIVVVGCRLCPRGASRHGSSDGADVGVGVGAGVGIGFADVAGVGIGAKLGAGGFAGAGVGAMVARAMVDSACRPA